MNMETIIASKATHIIAIHYVFDKDVMHRDRFDFVRTFGANFTVPYAVPIQGGDDVNIHWQDAGGDTFFMRSVRDSGSIAAATRHAIEASKSRHPLAEKVRIVPYLQKITSSGWIGSEKF